MTDLIAGPETLVNTTTTNNQSDPAVASLVGGGYTVTWTSYQSPNSIVYMQRYDAAGNELGSETQVNTTPVATDSSVVALTGGGYVVVWVGPSAPSGREVYIQRYDADGNPDGAEVHFGAFGGYGIENPTIAPLSAGGFVVTWRRYDEILSQTFDSSGNSTSGEIPITPITANAPDFPAVAGLTDGGFIVVWEDNGSDGDGYGIFAQHYDADGNAVGGQQLTNTTTVGNQRRPEVAALSDGGSVVVWQHETASVYLQRYDASGNSVGGETLVNTTPGNSALNTAVAALSDGGYVVTWQGVSPTPGSGTHDIYMQRYDANGNEVGDEVLVNTTTPNTQGWPSVATGPDGGVFVVWVNEVLNGVFDDNIYSKLFSPNNVAPDAHDVSADANEDSGNPILIAADYIDPNAGDGHTFTIDTTGTFGTVINNGDGTFSYDPNGKFESLPEGATTTDSFSYTVDDGNGGSDTASVTVTIHGELDALDLTPGNEMVVNTTTAGYQTEPAVDVLIDGGYVVTWTSSFGQDGSDAGVYMQRYDAHGNAGGAETLVNTTTTGYQSQSAITALADGGYVVSWTGSTPENSNNGIYIQRYDSTGNAVGEETLVNVTGAYGYNSAYDPSLTGLADGGYLVTWTSGGDDPAYPSSAGIYSQRFDSNGDAVGGQTLVDTNVIYNQNFSTVAGLADGGYVVAWESSSFAWDLPQDGSGYGIYMQRFDSTGAAAGEEMLVNTTTELNQRLPQIAALSDGGYVVTWIGDGTFTGIYTQRYDASGNAIGGEVFVSTATFNALSVDVSQLADGGYAITWRGYESAVSSYTTLMQIFDAAGNPVGDQTRIDPLGNSPVVAGGMAGGVFVAWEESDESAPGISDANIHAKLFSPPNAAPDAQDVAADANENTGTPILITADYTDSDVGDSHTFSIDTTGTLASVTDNGDGTFNYDTDGAFESLAQGAFTTDSFTYTVYDGNGGSDTGTVTVTVHGENDPPSQPTDTNTASNNVAEGAAIGTVVGITAHATDIDGDTLTYALTDSAGGRFAINSSTGAVTVANGGLLDYETANSHTITVEAADASGATGSQTFTINMTNVAGVTINGTAKGDTINGTSTPAGQPLPTNEEDTIRGGGGNDTINALGGNDILNGGAKADTLTGGSGRDIFAFVAASDSGPGSPDIITDFIHAVDIIDLSAIDANTKVKLEQAFSFAGGNTVVIPNSVTWFESGGNTIIQADVNGNATADFTLVLTGINHGLTVSDFIL